MVAVGRVGWLVDYVGQLKKLVGKLLLFFFVTFAHTKSTYSFPTKRHPFFQKLSPYGVVLRTFFQVGN